MSYFSNKLKELRKLYGLKQEDIAEIMGVSRQMISRYETGSQEPSLETVISLAKIFNVPISYFVKSTQTPPSGTVDLYPYQQMIFTPYVLSNQSYRLDYAFPDMSGSEEYALSKHSGSIHFECGLHSLAYDFDNEYHVFCNFIIFYNDTGELENAIMNHSISMIDFLYIIHKALHILDVPFDEDAYYGTYNKYYLKKRNGSIVGLQFARNTERIAIVEDIDLTLSNGSKSTFISKTLNFWFSKSKKERIKFAQEYYKMLIKKTFPIPEPESDFKINISNPLSIKL